MGLCSVPLKLAHIMSAITFQASGKCIDTCVAVSVYSWEMLIIDENSVQPHGIKKVLEY